MEQLPNGYTLDIPAEAFPLSTDSMLLSGFVHLQKQAKVLDLGSGCGTIGLFLCAKDPGCSVTGIELSEASHQAALRNIDANGLTKRMSSICADIRSARQLIKSGSYDICLSNPPYFSGGPASTSHPDARRCDKCSTADLFAAAAWAVRYGGDFCLVHRPEKLAELCAVATAVNMEPKRLCLVRHQPEAPISLILLHCRKGGKSGLAWEELYLFDSQGNPSDHYRELYHL